jgi:DNA-binding transcriptional LysR family regulator
MPMDPDLRVDRLRALVAVARAGGFSRAARAVGRTQSSISQAVASLEDDVGELLVVRDGRRIHLTDAGRLLVDHGERVLAALADARAALAALRDVTTGALALGTTDTFAVHLLPPALAAFRAAHPRVDLHLDTRPSPVVAARVAERALDVGVVSLPLPAGLRVTARALAPLREVAIAPVDHALARRRRADLATIAAHPLVLLDRSTSSRAALEAAFAARRVTPRVALETTSVEVIKRLVGLGFGVAVVPEVAVRAEVARGELAAIALVGAGVPRQIGVVVPEPGPPSRAARAMVAAVEASLRAGLDLPAATS